MLILKMLRTRAKETQAEVAAVLGVDRTTYTKYESGASEPSLEMLQRLAQHFGVTTAQLIGDDSSGRFGVKIPVFGAVAAGIPIEAIEDIVDYEEIPAELATTGEFFGLRIKGDSMEPRIREGDVVIVRRQEDADTGDTAIVLINGYDATCKRIKKDSSGLWLLPNNPAHEPVHFGPEEISSLPVRIIGKVVELRGKF